MSSRILLRSCPIKVLFSATVAELIIFERLSGGRQRAPPQFLEVLENNLEFGKVGGVCGAAAEKDVVKVGGKAREGGNDSGSLSVQGYTIVGAHPLDLLLHLGHPLLVHFLTQVKNGSSGVDQEEEMVAPLSSACQCTGPFICSNVWKQRGRAWSPPLLPVRPNF